MLWCLGSKSQLSPREQSESWNACPGWRVVAWVRVLIRSPISGEVRLLCRCPLFCLGSPGWACFVLPALKWLQFQNGADVLWEGMWPLLPGTGGDLVWGRWASPLLYPQGKCSEWIWVYCFPTDNFMMGFDPYLKHIPRILR